MKYTHIKKDGTSTEIDLTVETRTILDIFKNKMIEDIFPIIKSDDNLNNMLLMPNLDGKKNIDISLNYLPTNNKFEIKLNSDLTSNKQVYELVLNNLNKLEIEINQYWVNCLYLKTS
jgi:hypothetical protein